MRHLTISAAIVMTAGAALASPTVQVTYEAPGIVNSTAVFAFKGIENFDSRSAGITGGFTTDFGTGAATTQVSATYTGTGMQGFQVNNFDQYGGALQTSGDKYAVAFSGTPYSIIINSVTGAQAANGLNYFGYWLSALDGNNGLQLYAPGEATPFFSYTPTDVLAAIGNNPAYFGMPVAGPHKGQNSSEPYVFVNFYVTGGSIGRIDILQSGGGGYESDNHTVGLFTAVGGVNVPEPASLALLGAGLLGLGLIRRKRG